MRVPFIKMHGLGNDFVVLDARADAVPVMTNALAAALADRKTGIGCDQLILLGPSSIADLQMRIFNADGGEVESCGNAARAIGLLHGAPAKIETKGGIIASSPVDGGISVDMGDPRFGWDEIPLAYAMDTLAMPVGWPTTLARWKTQLASMSAIRMRSSSCRRCCAGATSPTSAR